MVRSLKILIRILIKCINSFILKSNFCLKIISEFENTENSYDRIYYKNKKIYLIKKNNLTNFRNKTFFTKEPETIQWIEEMKKDKVFWDVGSNIGLYSIFACFCGQKKVVSFEPSFFNLTLLSKNINKNKLNDKIVIVPNCLNDREEINQFFFPSTEYGSANNNFGYSNKSYKNNFSYKTLSLTLDKFLETYKELSPRYLKIDVDGIEYQILNGGKKLLNLVDSVLVESNSSVDEKKIIQLMKKYKLYLKNKYLKNSNLIFEKKK